MARILVVDDDNSSLVLIRAALERVGHEVETVLTGEEGLQSVRRSSPDILLLDIRLRNLSGYDIAKRLRAEGFLQMPIIAVSVPVHAGDEETAVLAGCDAFLAKPFNLETLRSLVADFLPESYN